MSRCRLARRRAMSPGTWPRATPRLGDALGAKGVLVMADDALIDWDTDLSSMREVAFMSPMSGG